MNPLRPISISLSPNTEKDDIWLAFKLLFQPWNWKTSTENSSLLAELENEFKKYLGIKYAFSFNSGRSALMAILHALGGSRSSVSSPSANNYERSPAELSLPPLGSEKNGEVLLQAFTCNAAANPIIWAGLKPVYVDCDENTFNIDAADLKRKLTPKSKIVIVQHTFGLPADMDTIAKICRENNLALIEDCAHALGAEYSPPHLCIGVGARGHKVGTFGKASFFSFSRDKVISSVYGGMAVTNDEALAKKLKDYQDKIGYPSYWWIFQQLLHPVLMNWEILPTYKLFGKYILVLAQQLRILSKAVHWKEKRGEKPYYFPRRLPDALALLALNQLPKLERFNSHRKYIAEFYRQALQNTSFKLPVANNQIYLRFTIKHPKAHDIIKTARLKNILLGDWYDSPIAPADTKLEKMEYSQGSCPKAEKLAKETLNLPTHINISKEDANKIVAFLKKWK